MRAVAGFHFFTIDYIATDDSCAKELKRSRKTTTDLSSEGFEGF